MPRRMRSSSLLLALVACDGHGELSGIPGFGELQSAVWLNEDTLILSNQPDYCEMAKDGAEALRGSGADVLSCKEFLKRAVDIGEAYDTLYDEGAMHLELRPSSGVRVGSYPVHPADEGESADCFRGRLFIYHGNPYTWIAENYDCGDPDGMGEYVPGFVEHRDLSQGELSIRFRGATRVRAKLTAQYPDAMGYLAEGDHETIHVEGRGAFVKCTVPERYDIFDLAD